MAVLTVGGRCEDVCVMTHRQPGVRLAEPVVCDGTPAMLVVYRPGVTATGTARMCRPCATYAATTDRVERVEPLPAGDEGPGR